MRVLAILVLLLSLALALLSKDLCLYAGLGRPYCMIFSSFAGAAGWHCCRLLWTKYY